VYNGADTSIFRPGAQLQAPIARELEGKRVVLYVGHFGLRKGLFYLLKAMRHVTERMPDAVLVCVGGVPDWLGARGYWDLLDGFIDQMGLRGNVFLMDRVPNRELPAYYCKSSVVVLPSYYEAFAKVLVEAMACGVPVVSSKMGGALDAIDQANTGFLVEYGDVDGTADAIMTILGSEKLARRMGQSARQRVLEHFTWDAVANRIDDAYAQVLRERWPGHPEPFNDTMTTAATSPHRL
jgi:phosphatidylinositol alpha-1,6-mannosyltransferase